LVHHRLALVVFDHESGLGELVRQVRGNEGLGLKRVGLNGLRFERFGRIVFEGFERLEQLVLDVEIGERQRLVGKNLKSKKASPCERGLLRCQLQLTI
jgi:hypothetical protein